MDGFSCPKCSHWHTVADLTDLDHDPALCVACGATIEPLVDGVRTIAYPESKDSGAETVLTGSGTLDLDASEEAEAAAIETVVQAALVVRGTHARNGRVVLAGARTSVGRSTANIVVADPAMSATHFEVEVRGDDYFVHDLESSNGTFLNERSVRAAELSSGDVIRAGGTTFAFTLVEMIRADIPSE